MYTGTGAFTRNLEESRGPAREYSGPLCIQGDSYSIIQTLTGGTANK
jgi:hypothetical protein